ncbi:hypothetical protein GCM10020254_11060 [Streptomyces goshikiensis]
MSENVTTETRAISPVVGSSRIARCMAGSAVFIAAIRAARHRPGHVDEKADGEYRGTFRLRELGHGNSNFVRTREMGMEVTGREREGNAGQSA